MKFSYQYRTSDNVLRSGIVEAVDRDSAYLLLREKGIRPARVEEVPGIINKLLGKGKRWIAIVVLTMVAIGALLSVMTNKVPDVPDYMATFDLTTRRQILGDVAVVEKGIATGWSEAFEDVGDRYLAGFAVPGVDAAMKSVTEDQLIAAVNADVETLPSDPIEFRQVKAIVRGLKSEIRSLVRNEGWSYSDVMAALLNRQKQEVGYYQRAQMELNRAESDERPTAHISALLDKWNEELRMMGIRTLPMPQKKTPY